ncbi:MAG: hypothetical protein CMP11_04060 [Zetaproteobacteria bacterium]|nr:hypothetical protein [Pseudobdellovibrionaceae bacterium]
MNKKIKRLFIANRGEIVRRIAYSAKKLGIETSCIISKKAPLFLRPLISNFILVKEENLKLYLDSDRLINIAIQNNCDAIHPGFGFLSENADFCQKVQDAGLTWIGPSSSAIKLMADKSSARSLAHKLNISCTKGVNDFIYENKKNLESLINHFNENDFPLLIKASWGGGGKGMRLVNEPRQLEEMIIRASSEAENAFGKKNLIIEQYISQARHVEVQVLADKNGEIQILGDRDCSIQRRHQKIIEEAPAPNLSPSLREELHLAAKKLAKSVQYESCGTVEFMVPTNTRDDKYYFLEMNTRLQVEHTVTEEVFSIDLVAWQLKIAQGETLNKTTRNKQVKGHSIQARIYAEDVEKNFLPFPDAIHGFLPFQMHGIRWEIGIDCKDEISNEFDPMLAKVVSTSETRKEAIEQLNFALKNTFLASTASNKEFIQNILENPSFIECPQSTNFIQEKIQEILESINAKKELSKEKIDFILPTLKSYIQRNKRTTHVSISEISKSAFSFKPTNTSVNSENFENKNLTIEAIYSNVDLISKLVIFSILDTKNNKHCATASYASLKDGREIYFIDYNGSLFRKEKKKKQIKWTTVTKNDSEDKEISSPVPGKIVKVLIEKNKKIKKNQACFILESMKMEFDIKSNAGGTVKDIIVKEGEVVTAGKILAQLQ